MGKQKERQEPHPNFLGRWAYTRYLYLSEDFIPMALIPSAFYGQSLAQSIIVQKEVGSSFQRELPSFGLPFS